MLPTYRSALFEEVIAHARLDLIAAGGYFIYRSPLPPTRA